MLPRGTMRDIVTSYLPFWDNTRLWVIARPLSGFAETFSQYIVEVSAGRRQRPARARPRRRGRAVRRRGRLDAHARGRGARPDARRLRVPPAGQRLDAAQQHRRDRRASTGSARPTSASTASTYRSRSSPTRPTSSGIEMPGTEGALDHAAVRRPDRRPPRHARQHRQFRARRRDPVPGDPRDGARALRPRGQGRLPAQQGLGRGAGGRLHVAARLLPAGLLRRAARAGSGTCSTRTSTGTPS